MTNTPKVNQNDSATTKTEQIVEPQKEATKKEDEKAKQQEPAKEEDKSKIQEKQDNVSKEFSVTIDCFDDQEQPKKIKQTYKCKGGELKVYKIDKKMKENAEGKHARVLYEKKIYHNEWITEPLLQK